MSNIILCLLKYYMYYVMDMLNGSKHKSSDKTRKWTKLWKLIEIPLRLRADNHDKPITLGCYANNVIFGLCVLMICSCVVTLITIGIIKADNGTVTTSDELMAPVTFARICKLLAHIGCIVGEQRRDRQMLLCCTVIIALTVMFHTALYLVRYSEMSSYSDEKIKENIVENEHEYKNWTGAEFRRLFYFFIFGTIAFDIIVNGLIIWCCYVLAEHVRMNPCFDDHRDNFLGLVHVL